MRKDARDRVAKAGDGEGIRRKIYGVERQMGECIKVMPGLDVPLSPANEHLVTRHHAMTRQPGHPPINGSTILAAQRQHGLVQGGPGGFLDMEIVNARRRGCREGPKFSVREPVGDESKSLADKRHSKLSA
jgi:hypothetical protein